MDNDSAYDASGIIYWPNPFFPSAKVAWYGLSFTLNAWLWYVLHEPMPNLAPPQHDNPMRYHD